mmetsp:Transcript_38156/g.49226  ORF Transcript_38156/g.49226 Transcript_38156/m.49226 type:complete len:359 (+) Transcript_38156:217-1293(+)
MFCTLRFQFLSAVILLIAATAFEMADLILDPAFFLTHSAQFAGRLAEISEHFLKVSPIVTSQIESVQGDIQTAFQLPPRIAHQLQQLEQLFLPPELRKRNPTSPTKQNRQGLLPGFNPKGVLTSEEKEAFQNLNQQSLDHLLEMVGSQEWDYVTERQGVKVWKRFLPSFLKHNKEQIPLDGEEIAMAERAAKFAAVKAFGVIDAPVEEVYKLFLDNSRVSEYNDQCAQVADLEYVNENTKVTWACTPRYGPIKARDFCTVVHYRKLSDGTCVVVNRPTNHEQAKRSDEFVRSEILIAGNIMRPNADDPENKTDFYSVTHVNPGGICDSKPFAMVMNALCANAPVSFIRKLEVAANKDV